MRTNNILQTIKQTKLYKQLTRRQFQETKKYCNFTEVALNVAGQFEMLTRIFERPKTNSNFNLQCFIWHNIFVKFCKDVAHFPVYCLSTDLTNLLRKTDPLKELVHVQEVFSSCLVLLPNELNIFQDQKNQIKVTHLLLSFYPTGICTDANMPDYIKNFKDGIGINQDTYTQIVTLNGEVETPKLPTLFYSFLNYSSLKDSNPTNIVATEGLIQFNKSIYRIVPDVQQELDVFTQIDDFVCNLFLFLQTQQNVSIEYVEQERGFKPKNKSSNLRSFIKLDVPNKPKVINCVEKSGTHESPITHWRRGHWRNQPCGEKLQNSKLIWIQPTLINAKEI